MFPGHSDGPILQRFRGMTSLYIEAETSNGIDEDLLDWAVYEAKHFHHQLHQRGGHQFTPLVRLEDLTIDHKYDSMGPQSRTTTALWKILQDGLLGFSSTLSQLMVTFPRSDDGMTGHVFTVPRPLPKLKSLVLHELAIHLSVWKNAPNIEKLYINFNSSPPRDSATTPDESQDDQTSGAMSTSPTEVDATTTTTTAATAAAAEQQPRRFHEFWLHCPKLTNLVLHGRTANFLDPYCLHLSPNLQNLEISVYTEGFRYLQDSSDGDYQIVREALKVFHLAHWTWDWSFPVLHTLTLEGDLHEFRFSMRILRSCPTLKWLELRHSGYSHPFPLRFKGVLDASMDKNNQMLPFTHSNLKHIYIYGNWHVELDEADCLQEALPGLTNLVLAADHFDEGFGDSELIEITKTHPSLEYVSTDTTMKYSTQGMREERSVFGASGLEHYHETIKERTEIVYVFKYDRYNLQLQQYKEEL
ncbi:hypothetical protein BGW42_006774 [Actinomortierella wolfii]|nr:hypothetical protein BGW42_006774 [Actinomortierella wolfii]